MKTLLVIARDAGLPAAIRSVLDAREYRVVALPDDARAEAFLAEGLADACLIDADLTDVKPARVIERVKRASARCPILVVAGDSRWEWEEEAYRLGVRHILHKPIRGRVLSILVERLWSESAPADSRVDPPDGPVGGDAASEGVLPGVAPQALEELKGFSGILANSLNTAALLERFILRLREILGVNRVVIFLRRRPGQAPGTAAGNGSERQLTAACALGVSPTILQHLELTLDAGIGAFAHRQGRILEARSEVARRDGQIRKEFELLGARVAIPVLDREQTLGVALFDGRLTGEDLSRETQAVIFHLLEEVGLAIRNSWLHEDLAASREMVSQILDQSGAGCVLVASDLAILHANGAAAEFFLRAERKGFALEFSDLPQTIGSKVFETLRSGKPSGPFKFRPQPQSEAVYRIQVRPFTRKGSAAPDAALLLVEDFTQNERSQRLEIEASNLRLVKTMAEHLAHEIGNSLVPLSTHQQLLAKKYDDPEFRQSLGSSMADAVNRISRLSNQMLFLARDTVIRPEPLPVASLVEESFQEAQKHFGPKPAALVYDSGGLSVAVSGDRAGLRQALSEVMLNALQANPPNAPIQVRSATDTSPDGGRWLHIEVRDAGRGLSPEARQRVSEPFFSTRNVGLGLGLAVTRKIIETHRGRVEFPESSTEPAGIVRISLPLDSR